METKKLPVGIDIFEKLRKGNHYYVDKTPFISALLNSWGEVNLFTRPRRFGKTLTMSMLQAFFEISEDHRDLFAGLAISQEKNLCTEHMNRYPVIFLTLKSVEAETYQAAMERIASQISQECIRLEFLADSQHTSQQDRRVFAALTDQTATPQQLADSLRTLSRMLEAHYRQKIVLLIDEYDVPLDKAFHNGYYSQMISFMRLFLGEALKTNKSLNFAAITGCLRISKESIFTGLNNLKTHTLLDNRYDEYFGFTDAEVKEMLSDYGLPDAYQDLRTWYNGYLFGQTDIYCPWDIINHVDRLRSHPQAQPEPYWNNTSSNELVKRFIDKADATTRQDIEHLIAGKSVHKQVREDLTYPEIDESVDNLWSVLLLTGYLTHKPQPPDLVEAPMALAIPNREVRSIFIEKIQKWFAEKVRSTRNREELDKLEQALLDGNCKGITEILRNQLRTTISYYDSYEGYYHGFLAGLLKGCSDWGVSSNRESGDGRSDILIVTDDVSTGIIIEVKRSRSLEDMSGQCEKALRQIDERNYQEGFLEQGITKARVYGVAFWKKTCCVMGKAMEIG